MAGAAGSIAGDSYEVVDAIASKNQDELFEKYGVKDWAELGNRVLDQAGTSMAKGAIFGSFAAGQRNISVLNSILIKVSDKVGMRELVEHRLT